jgi:hypothetical protein
MEVAWNSVRRTEPSSRLVWYNKMFQEGKGSTKSRPSIVPPPPRPPKKELPIEPGDYRPINLPKADKNMWLLYWRIVNRLLSRRWCVPVNIVVCQAEPPWTRQHTHSGTNSYASYLQTLKPPPINLSSACLSFPNGLWLPWRCARVDTRHEQWSASVQINGFRSRPYPVRSSTIQDVQWACYCLLWPWTSCSSC